MQIRMLVAVGIGLILGSAPLMGSEEAPTTATGSQRQLSVRTVKDCGNRGCTQFQPVFGRGYIAYSYPAVDSCPCVAIGCYHPGRYFHGGKTYRRHWRKRWLRAHLGLGSMLDEIPCDCILPTFGRPYHLGGVTAAETLPIPQPAVNSRR